MWLHMHGMSEQLHGLGLVAEDLVNLRGQIIEHLGIIGGGHHGSSKQIKARVPCSVTHHCLTRVTEEKVT